MAVATSIKNNVQILTETVIPISKINDALPFPINPGAAQRWMRQGVGGHRLETASIGQRRFTSKEAVQRFLAAVNGAPEFSQKQARPTMPRRDFEAARQKYNLPAPGRGGKAAEANG